MTLLISASTVARITGVNHQHLILLTFLIQRKKKPCKLSNGSSKDDEGVVFG
jgi:hypothetical protein